MPPNSANSVLTTPPLPAAPPAAIRISALDWTKGALVIFMVIYHAINYSAFRPMAFEYLSFLPPSFILIAGFLVGQVYASKYDLSTWKPYLRLAIRGAKLLVLFTLLNLLNCIMIERSLSEGLFIFSEHAPAIFLSGNGRVGIFEVLLPIAYFLMIAPALLWLRSKSAFFIPLFALSFFVLCLALESSGRVSDNLGLLSSGIIGMALGLVPIGITNRVATQWIPVLLCYLAYLVCRHFFGEPYAVQTGAAIASLLLLYCCASHLNPETWSWRQIVLLGHYSLFAYLAQILLLRLVVKLIGGKPQAWSGVVLSAFSTALLLFLTVWTVQRFRQRNRLVDFSYKAVFA